MCETCIRPIVMDGCEVWTMTKKSEKLTDTLERTILRRICGSINENGMWRMRHNKEIYDLFKEPEISTLIKLKRLQWAGHVQRMNEGRIPKRVMTEVMSGRRQVRWVNPGKHGWTLKEVTSF